ncbi:MAG: glycosyltransferase family 47 protein, partial [Verrucomicrobiota bacterium]|nr:glycosyltransferase family 47 protein [Verrucomicrobiota bacterium]
SLTDDPAAADLILFVESYGAGWHFERVRQHPLVRRYREKCFIFCSNPFVIPFLPGIYTGVDARWASHRTVCGFYLAGPQNDFLTYEPPTSDLPYLFSFVGSIQNALVRRAVARLQHPRYSFQETSADFEKLLKGTVGAETRREYYRRYAETGRTSKFVLCPRGVSASSIRLFETMRIGRVPVILSDDWVEPPGPRWRDFAIRVRERDCAHVPRILEERESAAVEMGTLARTQWLDWFSPEAAFHRSVEWCLLIKQRRTIPERLARWPIYLQYLRPFHFRRLVGSPLRAARTSLPSGEIGDAKQLRAAESSSR